MSEHRISTVTSVSISTTPISTISRLCTERDRSFKLRVGRYRTCSGSHRLTQRTIGAFTISRIRCRAMSLSSSPFKLSCRRVKRSLLSSSKSTLILQPAGPEVPWSAIRPQRPRHILWGTDRAANQRTISGSGKGPRSVGLPTPSAYLSSEQASKTCIRRRKRSRTCQG